MFPYIKYCLLDAAQMQEAFSKLYEPPVGAISLYKGRSEEEFAEIAPYLVRCESGSEFSVWLFENGWGKSWGVFIDSKATMEELHKHFRKFLLVQTEEGEELYFRFYDPRVLRIFLPTCSRDQLLEFFGPVQKYICEGEDPNEALLFSLSNGLLVQNTLKLKNEADVTVKIEEKEASRANSEEIEEVIIL